MKLPIPSLTEVKFQIGNPADEGQIGRGALPIMSFKESSGRHWAWKVWLTGQSRRWRAGPQ